MKLCAGFWVGMGVGMMAGVVVGTMVTTNQKSMKTQAGKAIHKLGIAVDHAVDNIVSDLH